MAHWIDRTVAAVTALALSLPGAAPLCAQIGTSASNTSSQNTQQGSYTFKMNAELVLTNVVARDSKTGELIRGLNQSDFSVSENGKLRPISAFDFQSVDM